MPFPKLVTVVHPDQGVRLSLASALKRKGYRVATDHSCQGLLSGHWRNGPDLILLDRSVLRDEGLGLVARVNALWAEAQTLFLPEGLGRSPGSQSSLFLVVQRLLGMPTTRELLS